jgi:hypothetical protein
MKLTRRDYYLLAHALHTSKDQAVVEDERMGVAIARQNIVQALQSNNTNFDRELFLEVARGERPCRVCNVSL